MTKWGYLRHAILVIILILIALATIGMICLLWLNVTIWIWGHYGDDAMMYWLIGCALSIALMLVITW